MVKFCNSITVRLFSVICAVCLAVFIPIVFVYSPRPAEARTVSQYSSEFSGVRVSADVVDSASGSYSLGNGLFAVAPFPNFSSLSSSLASSNFLPISFTFFDLCFSNYSDTDPAGRACFRNIASPSTSVVSGLWGNSLFSSIELGYSYYSDNNFVLNAYSYSYSSDPVPLDPSTTTFLSFRYGPHNSYFFFYYMTGFDFSKLLGYRQYYSTTLPFLSSTPPFRFTSLSTSLIRAYSIFEFSDSASHRLYFCAPLLSSYVSSLPSLLNLPNYFTSYIGSFSASDSYQSGYSAGFADGSRDGANQALIEYNNGYNAGQSDGYTTGFSAGVASANDYSFLSLMGSVIDTPIKAITSLLDFEVLGFNMSTFALSLLTICVILKIVSLISGG